MKPVLNSKYSLAGASMALAVILGGCVAVGTTETAEAETATEEAAVVTEAVEEEVAVVQETVEEAVAEVEEMTAEAKLAAVLAAQPEEVQARFGARNPAETLAFFGVEPGMTVAEALPGGGWYSKILISYLGDEGKLIGAHYPDDLWGKFGFGEEWAATRVERTANWPTQAAEWGVEGAGIASTYLTAMPEDASGQVDAVLFIRALHNLNRFTDEETNYMGDTLSETFRVLKPGGIAGVVQHSGPETNSDEWANGSNGYLKKSAVVAAFEAAGFEYVGSSDVNSNAADVPSEEEFVWRLPPSRSGTEEGTPERAAYDAIGESNRMTLKFRKPA
ncbi:MAG: class I SAM-dependent methyltransferase [Henriciella sp.]|nr:class I SAM-dependent methyltransferase [Henriciella sp.]